MPFNDKGEFIRSNTRGSSSTRTQTRRSADRSQPQRSNQPTSDSDTWEVIVAIILILIALAALAGLIWLVVVFRQWIVLALVAWLLNMLRKLIA